MSTSEKPISTITKNNQKFSISFPAAQNLGGDLKDY